MSPVVLFFQNGAIYWGFGSKLTDFAPKLAKVGAKLVPSWFKGHPSWSELVTNLPKLV